MNALNENMNLSLKKKIRKIVSVTDLKSDKFTSVFFQLQEVYVHQDKIYPLFVEKKPGVTDVRLLDRQPAEKHVIFSWEQVSYN